MNKFIKAYLNIITEQTQTMEALFNSNVPEAQSKFYFLKMFHDSLLADTLAKYFLNGQLESVDDPRIDVLADLFKKSYIDRTEIRHNTDTLDDLIFKLQSNVFTMKSNRGRHTAYERKPNFRKAKEFDNGVTIFEILGDTPEEAACDFSNILLFNNHLRKKEKLVIKPDTIIVVVHRFQKYLFLIF